MSWRDLLRITRVGLAVWVWWGGRGRGEDRKLRPEGGAGFTELWDPEQSASLTFLICLPFRVGMRTKDDGCEAGSPVPGTEIKLGLLALILINHSCYEPPPRLPGRW